MAFSINAVATTGLLNEVLATIPLPVTAVVKKVRAKAVLKVKKTVASGETNPPVESVKVKKQPSGIVKVKVPVITAKKALAFFSKDATGLGIFKDVVITALSAGLPHGPE